MIDRGLAPDSLAKPLPRKRNFVETLANVAMVRPDLAPQCESLSKDLRKLLGPPALEPTAEAGDDEIPF